jgi:hypothetical protein
MNRQSGGGDGSAAIELAEDLQLAHVNHAADLTHWRKKKQMDAS